MTNTTSPTGSAPRGLDRKAYDKEMAILVFTEQLVERMELMGMRRSELAEKLGKSKAHVTKVLRGANITFETAAELALAVGGHFLPSIRTEPQYVMSEPGRNVDADLSAPSMPRNVYGLWVIERADDDVYTNALVALGG